LRQIKEKNAMKKIIVATMLVAGMSFGTSAMAAMSKADCEALWKKADANADGKLNGAEAKPYIAAMMSAKLKLKDTKGASLTAEEFLQNCQKGTFDKVKK
jgi:hypothetical protein